MSITAIWDGSTGATINDVLDDANWVPYNIRDGAVRWVLSAGGTAEYYVELIGGGDPGFNEPDNVQELATTVPANLTKGTLGSLAIKGWGFGDADTLGFSTVYVRLTAQVDPDTLVLGDVTFTSVPKTNDNIFVPKNTNALIIRTDLSDRTLGTMVFENGHQQAFGTATIPMKIKCTSFETSSQGIGNIDLIDSVNIDCVIKKTAKASSGQFGLRLNGADLDFIDVRSGSVFFDPAINVNTIEVDEGARAEVPAGATVNTRLINRGTTLCEVAVPEIRNDAGTSTTDAAAINPLLICSSGVIVSNASGLVTDAKSEGNGLIDFTKSSVARNATTLTQSGQGRIKWNKDTLSVTNDIAGIGISQVGPAN